MQEEKLDSFFSEGTILRGTLKFKGLLRFDGDFEGSIQSPDSLIVGETGKVKADIKLGKLFNFGNVQGDVKSEFKIHLYAKSQLRGNIEAPLVVMEESSFFEGACKMPPVPKNMPREKETIVHKEPPAPQQADIAKQTAPSSGGKKGSGWFGVLVWLISIFAAKGA